MNDLHSLRTNGDDPIEGYDDMDERMHRNDV